MASFGSESSDESKQDENQQNAVLHHMLDLFMESLEIEVIQTILESCNYDYEKSKKALELLSSESAHHEAATVLPPQRSTLLPPQPSSLLPPQPSSLLPPQPSSLLPPQPSSTAKHPEHQRIQHAKPRQSTPMSTTLHNPFRAVQSPIRNVNLTDSKLERIHEYIREGNKILVLMRGCPGSGKTFLANQLLQMCGGERSNHVFSSDDYFLKNGKYVFNPQEIQFAHKRNQDYVLRAVRNGYSPVIVDNTNTLSWEMQVYVIMAVNHGYAVETLEPQTPWKFNHAQLIKRNIHNVPPASIRAMLDRYEHGLEGKDIIRQLKLNYLPSNYPPQPARNASNRRPEAGAAKQVPFPIVYPSQTNTLLESLLSCFSEFKQTSQQVPSIDTDSVRDQNPPAQETRTDLIQSIPKIPANISEKPSTSQAELPDFSHQNPILLPGKNSSSQISVSFLPDVPTQCSSPSVSQHSTAVTGNASPDSSESSSSVASQQRSDGDGVSVQTEKGLSNLQTPSIDIAGVSLNTADITNPAKELTPCEEETDKIEWEGASCEVVLKDIPKSNRDDNNSSTDQRQRWLLNNPTDTKRDEKQEKCTSGSVAQSSLLESNEWTPDKSVSSWEILSEDGKEKNAKEELPQRRHFVSPFKYDNNCNTNYQDFLLLASRTPSYELPPDVRLLTATSRDINANLVNYVPPIPKKMIVDVSTMTDNEFGGPVKGSLIELSRLFPKVSVRNLEDLLETCRGDVNWASNCLLDTDSGVRLDIASLPLSSTSPEVSVVDDAPKPELVESSSGDVIIPVSKPDLTESTCLNRNLSQVSVNLQSNESVGLRRCSSLPMVTPKIGDPQPVTPLEIHFEIPQKKIVESATLVTLKEKFSCPDLTNEREINLPVSEGSDESETSSQDDDEMLEFVISPEFSQQLFSRFGGPQNKLRKSGLSPVLRIPESIAHQIHYYLVLSQEYYAEDNRAEEDEEEMSVLNTQDEIDQELYAEMCAQKPLSEQEQEDMELARAIYELDMAAVYNSKETVCSVLARRLLRENFPKLDPNLLDELMEVHGNSYHKTKEMIQEHYMNSYTVKQKDFPALGKAQPKTTTRDRAEISDRVRLRTEADGELQIARIYNQKAKEQSAKREWSAAAVYSQMANVHKRQHNRNVEMTVQRVYADNMRSYCPSSLDLHFLVVEEALMRLDDFLDGHILSLQSEQPNKVKSLYIITGRGKHSTGGVPKIRPAVLERLDERQIERTLENPGLVRVEVTGRSQLSFDC